MAAAWVAACPAAWAVACPAAAAWAAACPAAGACPPGAWDPSVPVPAAGLLQVVAACHLAAAARSPDRRPLAPSVSAARPAHPAALLALLHRRPPSATAAGRHLLAARQERPLRAAGWPAAAAADQPAAPPLRQGAAQPAPLRGAAARWVLGPRPGQRPEHPADLDPGQAAERPQALPTAQQAQQPARSLRVVAQQPRRRAAGAPAAAGWGG